MNRTADRYLVVGNPIEHSRSPQIQQAFAAQFDDNMAYDKALVEVGEFAHFVDAFAASGGRGLNVTLPFKLDAAHYVDELDGLARSAGAVNTIKIEANGKRLGFNTDGIGLLNDLRIRHALDLTGKTILLLGAGGAGQGVLRPLLEAEPRRLVIANRTVGKAEALVAAQSANFPNVELMACAFDALSESPDVIINATSMGLSGDIPPISKDLIRHAFCYDMSYGASAKFQAWAQQHGAQYSVDGLGMLVEQAAQSYFIWRGLRPQTDPVVESLRTHLQQS